MRTQSKWRHAQANTPHRSNRCDFTHQLVTVNSFLFGDQTNTYVSIKEQKNAKKLIFLIKKKNPYFAKFLCFFPYFVVFSSIFRVNSKIQNFYCKFASIQNSSLFFFLELRLASAPRRCLNRKDCVVNKSSFFSPKIH